VLVVSVVLLVLLGLGRDHPEPVAALDQWLREVLAGADGHPGLAEDAIRLGSTLGYRVLWVPTVAVLVWTARWRHLLVYLGTISVMATIAHVASGEAQLAQAVRSGVTGSAEQLSLPAWPVVVLSTVAVGSLFTLTPPGRVRRWAWVAVVVLVGVLATTRVALGLEAASTAVLSAVLGCSAATLAFRLLAPEEVFPVVYRREVRAHLRLDAARTARVAAALRDQLGLDLVSMEPYRLDGSAGSTPCRLRVTGGRHEVLFGKLYASTHLRSDRWYKFVRVLRYGRLEDEAPFSSVRRLVEHEDYMLRLLRDSGVRVPEPFGVVEVVAGHEYLLVTGFVPDAVEILRAPMRDAVIDDALDQVRRLWAAGAAHRDIKPSNVLVQGDLVHLIDVSFGELRPSRWRQAVDLANMLLILGVAAGPEQVLARARRYFDEAELAEAFAATSGVTVPRQLRRLLDESGRDLTGEFRRRLPAVPRVRIQRWSLRRVLVALATVGGVVLALVLVVLNLRGGGLL
jgi:tRNA A-37 threonylcarbamoyl transferase component Bud32